MSESQRNQVFISYSHKDADWLEKLKIHLAPLVRRKMVSVWSDSEIKPGDRWREEIANALTNAQVAVLLVGPNFLASDFISEQELPPLLEAAKKQGVIILWIAVSASLYMETEIAAYQATNDPSQPLDTLSPSALNMELVKICKEIKLATIHKAAESWKARIFISYKREIEPDETIARQVFEALKKDNHDVFIDQKSILLGESWPTRIDDELRRCDFLVTLLSAQSVHSEMMQGEIKKVHQIAKEQEGHPTILPIRVAYRDRLDYPLNLYLDHINCAFWESDADTPQLISDIKHAISAGVFNTKPEGEADLSEASSQSKEVSRPLPYARPVPLEQPGGTMDVQSAFYIERSTDIVATRAIQREGVTVTIKGPRQVGKSSLLKRVIESAAAEGKQVVFLDFQQIDSSTLKDPDKFFRQFCAWITYELKLSGPLEEFWELPLGNNLRCTYYMQDYLLKELKEPWVLAMDEVERMFNADFRSDFFGMLRSWHNSRTQNSVWQKLDLVLVTSTEPYLLIENLTQSPFNVGEIADLEDFSFSQVNELNQRHGEPLRAGEVQNLVGLVGGHPYLVRRALYLIASERITFSELLGTSTNDYGPFGDHLRTMLLHIYDKKDLAQALLQVIRNNKCQDERVYFRLRGAGLVRRQGGLVVPRCNLYASYFKEHLNV